METGALTRRVGFHGRQRVVILQHVELVDHGLHAGRDAGQGRREVEVQDREVWEAKVREACTADTTRQTQAFLRHSAEEDNVDQCVSDEADHRSFS